MARLSFPQRGEVFLVNFDPTIGAEIKKVRPAIVIQNDSANRLSPIIIIATITSKFDDELYPTEVWIRAGEAGLKQDSVIVLNHIRSVDRQRILKKLGRVGEMTLKRTDVALKISLGLVDL